MIDNDDVNIPAFDKERIEDMVDDYRRRITALYKIAYLQGQIDMGNSAKAMLSAAKVEA